MKIEKPRRVSHCYEQLIHGNPGEIFPLYCPVKEALWCQGWDPVAVYSDSGGAEDGCVFVTEEGGVESAWCITLHDQAAGRVEMVKHTPGITMCRLKIRIEPSGDGRTRAWITYALTSLSPEGDKVLDGFTRENYDRAMDAWEKAMNHYLATGELLKGLPRF